MNNEDRCFCELAPLYALDLLDESDRAWVEQQVATDSDLAAELAEFQATVGAIAYSAPSVSMATDLKDRLFQRLHQPADNGAATINASTIAVPQLGVPQTAQLSDPETKLRLVESSRRRNPLRPIVWLRVGGAIAALAIVALSVDNYRLRQTTQEATTVESLLQQRDTVIYTLQGTENAANASGRVVVNPDQTVVMLVQNLPELPSGQAYRLWAMPKPTANPVYCGQFNRPASETISRWLAPTAICGRMVAQMLITAESVTAPPVPAGTLVMKSVL
jgi:anti-sigma-K factor RskA